MTPGKPQLNSSVWDGHELQRSTTTWINIYKGRQTHIIVHPIFVSTSIASAN